MNKNPWLISGAIIGIVAGIAFAPLLAVPVAVALGVGGGTLATTAIGCGIIATGGATGALIGDNSSSNPNRERDAKQNEHFAPNDEETKALKTKSSTPANTQSQEPEFTASLWTENKPLTSTPTQFKFTITNDAKSILQKLLKYQIEGVRKILEDEPERIPTESRFRQVWRSPKEEGEGEEEAKRGIRFRKNELSITIPQRIKLDKIKNFFKEVTIVEEDGSYKIKTSKEVFDKISATDITEFSSKTKDFEQLKLLQKNFETFNLYTLYLYKSENIKSDSENFKRTGEAKKESDELTSKIHALKFINTETFVSKLIKALNEFNQRTDESPNKSQEEKSDNNDSTKLPLAPDAPLIPIDTLIEFYLTMDFLAPDAPLIPINTDNSGAEEVGPSALIKNPNSSSTTRSSLTKRSTIRTDSQEKDSITDTPSPKTSNKVRFNITDTTDTTDTTPPSGNPKPAAPKLLQMAAPAPFTNTF